MRMVLLLRPMLDDLSQDCCGARLEEFVADSLAQLFSIGDRRIQFLLEHASSVEAGNESFKANTIAIQPRPSRDWNLAASAKCPQKRALRRNRYSGWRMFER